jgi:hypothetical protein
MESILQVLFNKSVIRQYFKAFYEKYPSDKFDAFFDNFEPRITNAFFGAINPDDDNNFDKYYIRVFSFINQDVDEFIKMYTIFDKVYEAFCLKNSRDLLINGIQN